MPIASFPLKKSFKDIVWVKDVILPILVTMVGVYLGLWTSQRADEQKDNHNRRLAVDHIRQELSQNQQFLRQSYHYHRRLHDSLTHWKNTQLPIAERVQRVSKQFQGLRPAFLQESAYVALLNSNLSALLPYDLYFSINRVYSQQSTLKELNQLYLTQVVSQLTSERADEKVYRLLEVYLADTIGNEAALVASYQRLGQQLHQVRF